jgi:hypothetical protein
MPYASTETRETLLRPAKKLFRLLEPAYADLSIESIPDFFSNALVRTRSRFGDECSIRDHGLFERDNGAWAATSANSPGLHTNLHTAVVSSADEQSRSEPVDHSR